MASDGLSHKFGITQDEHFCRDFLDANIMLTVPAWICQLPERRVQADAAYEVSNHLVSVLAALLSSRNARVVLLPGWRT